MENGTPIGQIELTIRQNEGQRIGYINLYYIVPDKFGEGLGQKLHEYL